MNVYIYNDKHTPTESISYIKGIRLVGIEALPDGKKHYWGLLEAKRIYDFFRVLYPEEKKVEAVMAQFFPGRKDEGVPIVSTLQLTFMVPRNTFIIPERNTITFSIVIYEA